MLVDSIDKSFFLSFIRFFYLCANFTNMKKIFLFLFLTLTFAGCDWFDYHPYDGRLNGQLDNNTRNMKRIEEALKGKDTFRFVFMSDTQRAYDDTKDCVNNINSRTDIDFVIHGGDITDFGLTKEFLWIRDIMQGLNVPYVALVGNHDILANGLEIYRNVFGKENFAFMAGKTKFVCLNTNALEHDYSTPIPDFSFIKAENDTTNTEHQNTIFAMHARPKNEQFNNNVADIFQDEIKKYPDPLFCINGHGHETNQVDLFDDGLIYYEIANIKQRVYYIFTVTGDTYNYEIIEF